MYLKQQQQTAEHAISKLQLKVTVYIFTMLKCHFIAIYFATKEK